MVFAPGPPRGGCLEETLRDCVKLFRSSRRCVVVFPPGGRGVRKASSIHSSPRVHREGMDTISLGEAWSTHGIPPPGTKQVLTGFQRLKLRTRFKISKILGGLPSQPSWLRR